MTAIDRPDRHIIKLALKEAPGFGDDFFDLNDGQNFVLATGGYTEGELRQDEETGIMVRDITLKIEVMEGSDAVDLANRWGKIVYWIKRTNDFMKRRGANIVTPSDGGWFSGQALVLTFQRARSQHEVYWYVLRAAEPKKDSIANLDPKQLNNVELNLTCLANPVGREIILRQGVRCGDLESPFDPSDPTYAVGWTKNGFWNLYEDAEQVKHGKRMIVGSTTNGDYICTNQIAMENGEKALGAIWVKGNCTGGQVVFSLERFDGSWHTAETINIDGSNLHPDWSLISLPVYTLPFGSTHVRLKVAPNSFVGSYDIDAFSCWINPLGDELPTEFISYGGNTRLSTLTLYGVQGHAETDLDVYLTNTTGTQTRTLLIGGYRYDPSFEFPVEPYAFPVKYRITDSFDRADSQTSMGSTKNGHTWAAQNNSTWGILAANYAYSVSDNDGDLVYFDSCFNDLLVQVDAWGQYDASNYRIPAMVFRGFDINNFLAVYLYAGGIYLVKVINGATQAVLDSAVVTTANATWANLKVLCSGDSITVSLDNLVVISYTLTGGDLVFTSPSYTKVGFKIFKGGSPTVLALFNNFDLSGFPLSAASLPWGVIGQGLKCASINEYPLLSDTFNRAVSGSSLGSADTGQAWTAVTGTWGITTGGRSGNCAYSVSDNDGDLAVTDPGFPNAIIKYWGLGKIQDPVNYNYPQLVFHCKSDNSEYLYIQMLGNVYNGSATNYLELWKYESGVKTKLAQSYNGGLDNQFWDFVVTINGNLVQVNFIDGTNPDISYTLSGGNTKFAAYTKVGLRVGKAGTQNSIKARWDDLTVTPITTPAPVKNPYWYLDGEYYSILLDRRSRRYRVFAVFAHNTDQSVAASLFKQAVIKINDQPFTISVNPPSATMTKTALANDSNSAQFYRYYELGDIEFPDRDTAWEDQTLGPDQGECSFQFLNAGAATNNTNDIYCFAGLVFIPSDNLAVVDLVTPKTYFILALKDEIAGIRTNSTVYNPLRLIHPSARNVGQPVMFPSVGTKLVNRFEIIYFRDKDGGYTFSNASSQGGFKFDASDSYLLELRYRPLYISGLI